MSWNCKCEPLVFKCFPDTSVEALKTRCGYGDNQVVGSDKLWVFVNEVELDASCDTVFACFADGMQWPLWFPNLKRVHWTSDKGLVGATRTVYFDKFRINEYFLVWEEGKRLTFRFDGMTRPYFDSCIEDYVLTDLGNKRCKLTHTVVVKPKWFLRMKFIRNDMDKMFRGASAGLKDYICKSYGANTA